MIRQATTEFFKLQDILYSAVVSDALDSLGCFGRNVSGLVPVTSQSVLIGRCRTTQWCDMAHEDPEPYAMELHAVDSLTNGDVMIAAAQGSMRSGIWGELLSTAASNSGCHGVIVDGAVRDISKMRQMGFSVFAKGACPLDSKNRQRVVEFDVPVELAGVVIYPGDLVVADEDGVVFVPADIEAEVIRYATEKATTENQVRDSIRAGMSAVEAYKQYGVL